MGAYNDLNNAAQIIRRVVSGEQPVDALQAAGQAIELQNLWYNGEEFAKIGAGACGEIYQQTGENYEDIAKRAKTDDFARQLRDDYDWHLQVQDALSRRGLHLDLNVLVPQAKGFAMPDADDGGWWAENRSRFPARAETLPEVVLRAERILPVPKAIRNCLITLYCEESRQEAARDHPGSLDCLVRLYLGKVRPERRANSRSAMFGLRNFQLYIDDMEELGLNTEAYAVSMAKALALMHWEVKCDANDVEFVLGGARLGSDDKAVELWLLDFNRVRPMTMDAEGTKLAADAFMVNDRYYPRPLEEKASRQKLWQVFATAYLHTSEEIQRLHKDEGRMDDFDGLPEAFLAAVVEAQKKHLMEKADAAERAPSTWTLSMT